MVRWAPEEYNLVPEQARRVFKGVIYDVYQWPQKMFDGSTETFEMIKRPDTVIVIPVIKDRVVLIDIEEPYRNLRRSIVAGQIDSIDKTPEHAAKRELKEETGMTFNSFKLVRVAQLEARTDWFVSIFVASDLWQAGKQNLDAGEKITPVEVEFSEFSDMLKTKDYANYELISAATNANQLLNLPGVKPVVIED